jgi:hypothetical protein
VPAEPTVAPRRSALRGKGLRISSDAAPAPAEGSATDRGRALLGKLIRRREERRPR